MYDIINANTGEKVTECKTAEQARWYIMGHSNYVIQYSKEAIELENKKRGHSNESE